MSGKPPAGEWVTFRQPFWRWYLTATVIGQVLFALLNVIPAVLIPGGFTWSYFWASTALGAALIPAFMIPAMFFYVRVWTVR